MTGRERVRLQFGDICGTACFVQKSQELLTASYDGALRLNVVDPKQLIDSALKRVPRRLTDAEWRRYLPDEPRGED